MRIRTIVISGFAFLAAAGTSLAATLTTGLVDVTAIADTEEETRLLCRIDDWAAVADTRHIAVDRAILHFSLAGEAAEQRLAVQMHPITRGWNAGSVDWTTGWIRAGGDFDDDVYGRAYVHFDRATSEVSVDITVPVREALLHEGWDGFILRGAPFESGGIPGGEASRFAGLANARVELTYQKTNRPPVRNWDPVIPDEPEDD
jgi:hypothetical protein